MSRLGSRFGRNSPAAQFEGLIRPHLDRLFRLAFRFTGSRADAEDLVQELCLRLFPKLEELKRVEQAGPWLARALHNLFIDLHRRESRSPVDTMDQLPEAEADEPGPLQRAMASATAERIQAALARLPEDHRAVIAWHDIEGYTLDELSVGKDLPLGTLKSRLHRARRALRQLLMEPFHGS